MTYFIPVPELSSHNSSKHPDSPPPTTLCQPTTNTSCHNNSRIEEEEVEVYDKREWGKGRNKGLPVPLSNRNNRDESINNNIFSDAHPVGVCISNEFNVLLMAQGVVRIKDLFALVYFRNFPFGSGGGGGTVSIWRRRQTKPTEEDELGKGSGLFLFLSPRQLGMSNPRGEIDLVQCKITTETNGESFPVASTSERRGWSGGGAGGDDGGFFSGCYSMAAAAAWLSLLSLLPI